ncbi:MAG TPA: hypothetical protein VFV92_12715 [Candidatus Bathyarchaeia archaeon]|nr:hypothetical protein [Candidatus Bathyarchaeia archaeon]
MTDEAYAKLLDKLADRNFAGMPPALRENILGFYSTTNVPVFGKKDPEKWSKVLKNVALLKTTAREATASKKQEVPGYSHDRAPR